ncbi:RNA polymerase sigma factor SigJ [Microbacterium foliorum]|uniref:ECF RNA polymerase sigma factor SigJ n=1 Tax=Microbacterium foliorum TaxID=104336 RepID=A0A0F0L2X8_9MICO|nr:RNA polymerase sigma factor SigJ [Microbacterium foliorum]AXL13531.1 RNA polymerase sigma factor SigJ [Microbacterium foliorum]KJL25861.1 ECF RNA polymerase sigma factor SigJ [Microbacterium foliorum]
MDDDLDDVFRERRRLLALGYRMTGTLADAEDIVQETYLRWYRLTDVEREGIANPAGWLTTVAGRVALDLLGSARRRREQYVGPWLPEPVPTDVFAGAIGAHTASPPDPLDRITLDDDVSTALLVVLEAMTPAERVAFVMHDVFAVPFDEIAEAVGRSSAAVRQLAASARRHVRESRAVAVPRDEHDRVVRAFQNATRTGEIGALLRFLAPDVELRSDGGGVVSAARNVVSGADHVARFLLGIAAKSPRLTVEEQRFGDGIGLVFRNEGAVHSVMNLHVEHGVITQLWIVLNPAKLTHWRPAL